MVHTFGNVLFPWDIGICLRHKLCAWNQAEHLQMQVPSLVFRQDAADRCSIRSDSVSDISIFCKQNLHILHIYYGESPESFRR